MQVWRSIPHTCSENIAGVCNAAKRGAHAVSVMLQVVQQLGRCSIENVDSIATRDHEPRLLLDLQDVGRGIRGG